MNVMAIDPSLTGFCTAIYLPNFPVQLHRATSKPNGKHPQPRARTDRWEDLIAEAVNRCAHHSPKLVVVEGPSYGSQGRATLDLAELRALLNRDLLLHAECVIECPPAVLKKFAAGKGNAPKTLVASELTKRYGRVFRFDDEADAYGLLMLALVVTGQAQAQTKAQSEAAGKLRELWERERGAV